MADFWEKFALLWFVHKRIKFCFRPRKLFSTLTEDIGYAALEHKYFLKITKFAKSPTR